MICPLHDSLAGPEFVAMGLLHTFFFFLLPEALIPFTSHSSLVSSAPLLSQVLLIS